LALAVMMLGYWLFAVALAVVGIAAQIITMTARSTVQLPRSQRCAVASWPSGGRIISASRDNNTSAYWV
jgi:hypothetical protein